MSDHARLVKRDDREGDRARGLATPARIRAPRSRTSLRRVRLRLERPGTASARRGRRWRPSGATDWRPRYWSATWPARHYDSQQTLEPAGRGARRERPPCRSVTPHRIFRGPLPTGPERLRRHARGTRAARRVSLRPAHVARAHDRQLVALCDHAARLHPSRDAARRPRVAPAGRGLQPGRVAPLPERDRPRRGRDGGENPFRPGRCPPATASYRTTGRAGPRCAEDREPWPCRSSSGSTRAGP